jgi:GNAT superfamily N-acetyltransferase
LTRLRQARLADARAIAVVHVDSWRTTYRGLLADGLLAGLSYDAREEQRRRALAAEDGPRRTFVAEAAGRIVGFAVCGPERDGLAGYDGELYAVYLLAEAQRRGIGTALLLKAARHLRRHGLRTLVAWVLPGNPGRGFYAALGGVEVATKPVTVGGIELEEVGYGWPDLGRLIRALERRRTGSRTS